MKIVAVHCHVARMGASWLTGSVIANPLSAYPEYFANRASWFQTMSAGVIEIVLEDGTRGFGFIGGGKASAAAVILDEQMRALIVGRSVFETELLQEQLYRASIFYGRGGLTQQLLSGIDIAMWDAQGKLLGQPACNLLGGSTRAALPVYYTGNDPDALKDFGIRNIKIAIPYGPAHGEEGMKRNEETVARAREILGPDAFIALDIYMAWDVPYTLRMYERIEKYNIAWLEEPVMPDDYAGYRQIRAAVNTMVTGGEHEYTLEGFRRLIEEECVDIVQPDIYRAGGPTGLKKIAALARAHHIKLICHGIGSPTYHFLSTNTPDLTPFVEYVDIYRNTTKDWVLTDDPRPVNGLLRIDKSKPGFGYDLNMEVFGVPGRDVAPIW
jgi:L-rhamnonate dehydratase